MEDEKEVVNIESSATQEQPVQEVVEETPVEAQEPQEQPQVQEPRLDVDEHGVPWKNRAMEYQRKFEEVPNIIRQTVEEATKTQQKTPEYTIEQLEQYATDNPQYRPWAEARKAELIQKNLEKTFDAKLQANEAKVREAQLKQQSEQWVTNHPKFKDCFIDTPQGKQWNYSNPLTQIMGNYLNQPDPVTGKLVKDRSDGLMVAAKLAYADHVLNGENKAATQVSQLKKDLRKAQKTQMVQGAGNPAATTPVRSSIQKSLDTYSKTYKKDDIKNATRAFLAASGLIKED